MDSVVSEPPVSQSDKASLPVDDDGTRVTGGGECAIFVAVGVYGNLQRCLLEGRHTRGWPTHATDIDSRGLTVFDYEKALLAIGIELLRFGPLDDAFDLEETAGRIFEVRLAFGMRVHLEDEVG